MRSDGAGRTDRDVVGDAAIVGNQRMADASAAIDLAGGSIDWGGPLGLSRRAVRELRQRIELGEGVEPAADARPARAPPALERKEHVEVPERERLHGKMQDRGAAAQLAEAEDAIQPAHAHGRRVALGREPVEQRLATASNREARVTACSKIAAYRPSASCPPPARSKIVCSRSAVANDSTMPATIGMGQRPRRQRPVSVRGNQDPDRAGESEHSGAK